MAENTRNKFQLLRKFLENFPGKYHFRLHKCFNLTVGSHWGFSDRRIEDYHMIYTKKGKGFYKLEEKTEPLEKGKLIFMTPWYLHSSGQYKVEPFPEIIPVRFGVYSNRIGQEVRTSLIQPLSITLADLSATIFPELFEKLYKCFCLDESTIKHLRATTFINEVLLEILEYEKNRLSYKDQRIRLVKEYIQKHPENRKTLRELAGMSGLTSRYFSKIFKAETGTTPVDYSIRLRCRKAEFLLQNTSLNVSEVSAKLGYPDPYSFSKQYRKVMGHPPIQAISGKN